MSWLWGRISSGEEKKGTEILGRKSSCWEPYTPLPGTSEAVVDTVGQLAGLDSPVLLHVVPHLLLVFISHNLG